jgi:hypothetical protein
MANSGRPSGLTPFLFGLLLLVIFQLIYYFPILFEGREYFLSDHTFFFEPLAKLIGEGFKSGHLTLWNPYCYCGMSELANPSPGLFYFPNLLFACFSYSKALVLIQCLHEIVAYCAGFWLCRLLAMGAPAAILVGISLAANGYFLSLPSNYTLPGTFAWGALGLCALLAVKRRPLLGAIVAALAVHWTLTAGRPEVFIPWFLTYGLLILLMAVRPNFPASLSAVGELSSPSTRKVFTLQATALVLGVLMSMLVIMPVYEWTRLSSRATGLDTVQIFHWSANWYDFLGMLLCQPLGDLQQPSAHLSGLVASRAGYYPFLASAYVGPVVIILVVFGCFDKQFKERFYFLGAALAAAIISLGHFTPVAGALLKLVPFFAVLRYPCKVLIFVVLFLLLLAGGGLRSVLSGRATIAPKIFNLSLWILATFIGVIFCVYSTVANYFGGSAELLHALGRPLLFMSLIGVLTSLAIILDRPFKLKSALSFILLAAFCAGFFVPLIQHRQRTAAAGYFAKESGLALKLERLNAGTASGSTSGSAPGSATSSGHSLAASSSLSSDTSSTAVVDSQKAKIQPPRLLTLYADPLRLSRAYQCREHPVAGESFMQFARELLLPNTNIDLRQPISYGYEAGETKDYSTFYLSAYKASAAYKKGGKDHALAHFCKLTSTYYVASHIQGHKGPIGKLSSEYFTCVEEDPRLNLRLYKVVDPLPRAFLTSEFEERSKDEFLESLLADVWDEPRQVVIDPLKNWEPLSDSDRRPMAAALKQQEKQQEEQQAAQKASEEAIRAQTQGGQAPEGDQPNVPEKAPVIEKEEVTFLQDQPEHVAISVKTPKAAFLVLNDRYYPGWQATVDSQPVTLYRANAFMRGVFLTTGAHLVEFDYKPESLTQGFYLTAVGTGGLLLLVLWALGRPARRLMRFLTTGE